MSVEDWQATYNGLLMGDGTAYEFVQAVGLDDLPDVRNGDVPRPQDHGFFPGIDYAGERTVELDIEVTDGGTGSDAIFRANLDALNGATVIQAAESALVFQIPGMSNRQIFCRPRKRTIPVDITYKYRKPIATVQFVATDPRIYGTTQQSLTLSPPVVSGGLAWPLSWPLNWGTATNNTGIANNSGTFGTRPVITFAGPLTNPKIALQTGSGVFLLFNLTLNSGDTLVVDTNARTVLAGGTSSRYYALDPSSTWFELAPGNNQLALTASSGTGTATVTWLPAYA